MVKGTTPIHAEPSKVSISRGEGINGRSKLRIDAPMHEQEPAPVLVHDRPAGRSLSHGYAISI